jgi:hypothetical protein
MQRVTCDDARQARGWQETFGPDQENVIRPLDKHKSIDLAASGLAQALVRTPLAGLPNNE